MTRNKSKKNQRLAIVLYLYVLLILMSLLTVASYTWFSLSKTPRVSDMNLYINAPTGLELASAPDAEEWGLQLDFRDLVDETAPLRPVTWSEERQQFFAASYERDGRITGRWDPLTDERHANKDNYQGYYIKATFYARTGEAVKVSLSPAVEVNEGIQGSGTYLIGTPLWNSQEILHNNGGQGAETAVRIGIRVTPMNADLTENTEEAVFYIYEPNCDGHIDGSTGYVRTPSIDGAATLIPQDRLILQTSSSWTEAYPVERDVVVRKLGEFTTPTELFHLGVDEMVRLDVYVWLEGQDVDCTNKISDAQIIASLQFDSEADNQSGMQPIEGATQPTNENE